MTFQAGWKHFIRVFSVFILGSHEFLGDSWENGCAFINDFSNVSRISRNRISENRGHSFLVKGAIHMWRQIFKLKRNFYYLKIPPLVLSSSAVIELVNYFWTSRAIICSIFFSDFLWNFDWLFGPFLGHFWAILWIIF